MSDSSSGPAFMRLAIVAEVEQGQYLVRQRIDIASSEQRTVGREQRRAEQRAVACGQLAPETFAVGNEGLQHLQITCSYTSYNSDFSRPSTMFHTR